MEQKRLKINEESSDDDSDISNIFKSLDIVDENLQVRDIKYKDKKLIFYLGYMSINNIYMKFNVTLKNIRDFLNGITDEIQYYCESHDITYYIAIDYICVFLGYGFTANCLYDIQIDGSSTIIKMMRKIYIEMIKSRIDTFYDDSNREFKYYKQEEIDDDLKIMMKEFKYHNFIPDFDKIPKKYHNFILDSDDKIPKQKYHTDE